jgi:ABC-type nitrate/sulfonate/bicarbonate transport system permease component
VVIAAEMVGVPKGIGYMLTVGRSTGRTEITIVTMLIVGFLMVMVEEFIFSPPAELYQRLAQTRTRIPDGRVQGRGRYESMRPGMVSK